MLRRYSQLTVMEDEGKIIGRHRINNDRKSIEQTLSVYKDGNGSKAVMESGWNWGTVYDMFDAYVDEVKVAHPLKVKAITEAKIKTDKISADTLAHLLRADLIPECYIRNLDSRRIQQVLRQRMFYVRLQTMIKNKTTNLIDRQEDVREIVHAFSDLFGKKGMQFLKNVELHKIDASLLEGQLELLEEIRARIKDVDAVLA